MLQKCGRKPSLRHTCQGETKAEVDHKFRKKERKKVKSLSRVRLFATPWTIAYQAPPFMGFSRQGYWSGLPFPSPGDLPDPGIEPRSPTLWAGALPSKPPEKSSLQKAPGKSVCALNPRCY